MLVSNAIAFYAGKSITDSGDKMSFQQGTMAAESPPCHFCNNTSQTHNLVEVNDAQKKLIKEKMIESGELDLPLDLANIFHCNNIYI